MNRAFRYTLAPTRAQERQLIEWMGCTREFYNAALQERRDAWNLCGKRVFRVDQEKQVPAVREDRPDFANIPVAVLRGTLRQLDKAFQAFFRRRKTGDTPGFPRFKGADRWNTLAIDDLGKKCPVVAGGKRLEIPLLGKIKIRLHRPFEGKPKAIRISAKNGKWFATLLCDGVEKKILPFSDENVGVDVGLLALVATSDGTIYGNTRAFNRARLVLERAQRRLSRRKKGSRRSRRSARILSKKHAHVANIRRESHIQVARDLVNKYGTIYIEKLNLKGLVRSKFARSIHDAGWGNFYHWLRTKAEEAGREVIEVNPAGTSQICSSCGVEVRKGLSVRVHSCPHCGLTIDRDVNAARNILRLGLSLRGAAPAVRGRRRSAKPESVQTTGDS